MYRYLHHSLIILSLLVCSGCVSKGTTELKDALTGAVKRHKLSPEKMEHILQEYQTLRKDDRKTARQYAGQIVNAIEMGGDSSHIDVVRRMVLKDRRPDATI